MPAIKSISSIPSDKVRVETKPCCVCGKSHTFELDAKKVRRWLAGEHIQGLFPELSLGECETLISGTCSKCFDELFPAEE